MARIEEQLLTNRAIFLNLTLQERATGLDDIVGDLSSFFGLPIYFWNLTKSDASRIVLRERIKTNLQQAETKQSLHLDLAAIVESRKSYASILTNRLQDKPARKIASYTAQSFEGIIAALVQVYRSRETGIFVVENINQLLTSKSLNLFQYEQIKTWTIKLIQKARETKDFYLIVLGCSGLEWDFEELAPLVKLPYLNHEEISHILQDKFVKLQLKDSDKYELTEKAGHILTGMSRPELLWGIANITNSLENNDSVRAYVDGLLEFKQEKLSQLGLSFLPPPEIDSVGGMDILKANIENLKILFTCDRQKYNIPQEQGWALVGVPGAGKSLIAKVMQFQLSLPMIHIPIEKVKDRGPAYLANILSLCEAYAPNIVYVDELDKMFTGGDLEGDAATTLAVFLTWLQEKQAPCFVLATLNRLDTLPPELLRSGRFSEVFYIGFPQPKERQEIFQLYLEKYDDCYKEDVLSDEQWRELIDESIKFTGAEIAGVVKKAYLAQFYDHRKACMKLEQELFNCTDLLKSIVSKGYRQKQQENPAYRLDLKNLDRQISKVLTELPDSAEKIDELYGQLSESIKSNTKADRISTTANELEQLINKGYQSVIETLAMKTIGLDSIDGIVAQALVDLAGQKARIKNIEELYNRSSKVQKALVNVEALPLRIGYQSVSDFTIAEIPLFERAVEKVMAIENRARKLCKPVSSKDTSVLVDKEPSFWQDMKPVEAVDIINKVRQKEAKIDGEEYEPVNSLDEAIDESDLRNYWAF